MHFTLRLNHPPTREVMAVELLRFADCQTSEQVHYSHSEFFLSGSLLSLAVQCWLWKELPHTLGIEGVLMEDRSTVVQRLSMLACHPIGFLELAILRSGFVFL